MKILLTAVLFLNLSFVSFSSHAFRSGLMLCDVQYFDTIGCVHYLAALTDFVPKVFYTKPVFNRRCHILYQDSKVNQLKIYDQEEVSVMSPLYRGKSAGYEGLSLLAGYFMDGANITQQFMSSNCHKNRNFNCERALQRYSQAYALVARAYENKLRNMTFAHKITDKLEIKSALEISYLEFYRSYQDVTRSCVL